MYSCYEQKGTTEADCLSFEQHEWSTHGVCAGADDAEDFFTQLCTLAVAPLEVMNASRQEGGDLEAMATALESAGYAIFDVDTSSNSQVSTNRKNVQLVQVCSMSGLRFFADGANL